MRHKFVAMDWVLTKIREFRKLKGYSQEQLADLLKIEQKTYSNWERGRTDMTLQNLSRIATALEIDVKELWDDEKWISKPYKPGDKDIVATYLNEDSPHYKEGLNSDLKKDIEQLKEQNLALTRAYNELYEKKADRKLMLH
jgi:transcriptional regulator with XRE-family HTH domain